MENITERVARHADADTRRAMGFGDIDMRVALGFPPRKLPPSDLKLRVGKTQWYVGRPFSEVSFDNVWHTRLVSTEDGRILWRFDMRKYDHVRPS
jgi:hypothetical protein